jgi:hypothetical protein
MKLKCHDLSGLVILPSAFEAQRNAMHRVEQPLVFNTRHLSWKDVWELDCCVRNITFGACSAAVGAGGVILPPINSDGTSVYPRKGGSTIPVRFRVCNAAGAAISNSAAVFAPTGGSLTMLSTVRGTIDNVNEGGITDVPDVAFRWSGDQWIFNMATSNLSAGQTYTFRINLAYGPASINFVVGVK